MPRRSFLETIQSKKILWFFITSYDFIFVVVLMWLYSMTLFHNKILIINNCFVVAVISLPRGVQLFVTPWTVTHQVSLSMGFPRQESWSGLTFPSPGHIPNPGIKPVSPALAGGFFTTELPRKASFSYHYVKSRYGFWRFIINIFLAIYTFKVCSQ